MLMVIFGAGASYDSSPTYTIGMVPPGYEHDQANEFHRPPLAKDLFANRPLFIEALERFPQCKTIVPKLRSRAVLSGQISIETVLSEIQEQATTYPRAMRELAAVRCYLCDAISQCEGNWKKITKGITNYLSLLRELERFHTSENPVCLVTFNYDTLLEHALERLGYAINSMEDYVDRVGPFKVFKLHGSLNWGQTVEVPIPKNVQGDWSALISHMIENAPRLQFKDRFVLGNSLLGSETELVFPAIAIPVQTKREFQCPARVIEVLHSMLPRVTKILVVGWRATEGHLLKLLQRNIKRPVEIGIVAGGAEYAKEVQAQLHRALVGCFLQCTPHDGGFTDFISGTDLQTFVASDPL
jgi:hypothetical protein